MPSSDPYVKAGLYGKNPNAPVAVRREALI